MKRRLSALRLAVVLSAFASSRLLSAAPEAEFARRIFDFTPVSEKNPIVARIGDSITIPASEYRAYQQAEKLRAIDDPTSLPQKRAVLESLIDQVLSVDESFRRGVADSPEFAKRMKFTRAMLLTDFLSAEVVAKQAKSPADNATVLAAYADRLFDAADIEVSNEAYDMLKGAAHAIDVSDAASHLGPVMEPPAIASAKLRTIVQRTPDVVLARYNQSKISVREILVIYAGLPAPRPKVDTHESFLAMIKPRIVPELMAFEAERQGIDQQPAFQSKLLENRSALLRFHAQGAAEREANLILKGPELEQRLQAWYQEHKADYAAPTEGGEKKIPSFAEARSRIEGDYSVALCEQLFTEHVQGLRKSTTITVDEVVLKAL